MAQPTKSPQTDNGIEPIRGDEAAPSWGRATPREQQSQDPLRSQLTDQGSLPNMRFSFADAHNRLSVGGWSRQVTNREMSSAMTIAGVDMRLNPGSSREMHWHKEAEWAYMLKGRARVSAVDAQGRTYLDDVGEGDGWYFPPASRIPFRPWKRAANSCWPSTTAAFRRTALFW
ncbi:MAG: cupin domain-containing protein [Hymenobacter sp.]